MKTINFKTGLLSAVILCFGILLFGCKKDKSTAPNSPAANLVNAQDFLSSTKYNRLQIEVQFVYGYKPSPTSIENLKSFLQQRLNKPAGIDIFYTSI